MEEKVFFPPSLTLHLFLLADMANEQIDHNPFLGK